MSDLQRSVVGILGSVFSLISFAVPIMTFRRIIKKKSTEGFSAFPYIVALFNSILYSWYGSPLVSNGWENIIVFITNAMGIVFEANFVTIFYIFAQPDIKKPTARTFMATIVLLVTIIAASASLHDHKHRKVLVGCVGVVSNIVLSGSPLSIIRLVIATKSAEFLPINLCIASFFGGCLWLAYGVLSHDILIMAPNFIGLPLGIVQIIIYVIYFPTKKIRAEDSKSCETEMKKNTDIEKEEQENKKENKEETDKNQDTEKHEERLVCEIIIT